MALISRVYILDIVNQKMRKGPMGRSRSLRQVHGSAWLTAQLGSVDYSTFASFDFYPVSLPSEKLRCVVYWNVFNYRIARGLRLGMVIRFDTPFPL